MMGVIIESKGTSYVHTKSEGFHKETEYTERSRETGGKNRHLTKYSERKGGGRKKTRNWAWSKARIWLDFLGKVDGLEKRWGGGLLIGRT